MKMSISEVYHKLGYNNRLKIILFILTQKKKERIGEQ